VVERREPETEELGVTYDKVNDDVLKQIAEGNGHTYRHEARAMARELQEFRAARNTQSTLPQQLGMWQPSQNPYPP
jgi:hypothetical protein